MSESKLKIATIFGTRPEAIKMAPLIEALRRRPDEFSLVNIITAQHREMIDQMLRLFRIRPDYDLGIMKYDQNLAEIVANAVTRLHRLLGKIQPDCVLVQGDTSTTFIGALAAFYHRIPVGHVEAGLRTDNKFHPFPEEINRRLTTTVTDLHFAPTSRSRLNLRAEGVPDKRIFVTGNTVIDALFYILKSTQPTAAANHILRRVGDRRLIFMTAHRRENHGPGLQRICRAVHQIVREFRDVFVVFPVHLNPRVRQTVWPALGERDRVHLCEPLDYVSTLHLMKRAYLILTDSGGIQEEAPSLGVPVLVLRETTERPEALEAGAVKLVGTDTDLIVEQASLLLRSAKAHRRMSKVVNPYGDGRAALRIVQALRYHFELSRTRPQEFRAKARPGE